MFSAFEPSALDERTNETIDHIVFSVRTSAAMHAAFRSPGQFVKMRVRDEAGASHEGIFAIASAPGEKRIAFLARTNNPSGGEAADRIARMPLHTPLEVTLPAGDGFALERVRHRDLALVAVGTALAPVRSVLEHILRERELYGALSLDYGLRSLAHLPFARDVERWRSLGVRVDLHVLEVRVDGTYEGSRAQDAFFARLGPRAGASVVIAVGPDALLRDVRDRYSALGGDPRDVLHNY